MTEPSRADPGAIAKLFGALLMAVGGLITGLCGLCSAAILGATLVDVVKHPHTFSQGVGMNVLLVVICGGIPIVLGVGVFMWGLALYRGKSTS